MNMYCRAFLIEIIILEQFQIHSKFEQNIKRFSIFSLPQLMHSLLCYQHPAPDWYIFFFFFFFTKDKPTLTHNYHPKSIVYIRIHSWCCIFYGFRQMNNVIYPPLQYHTRQFPCPKNLLCSTQSSFPPPTSRNHSSFFIYIYKFIYFLAAPGFLQLRQVEATLCCSAVASVCFRAWAPGTQGSVVVAHRLSSCGTRAQLLCGMWDLPGPGLAPVSPALAGGFLTTAPPGKPLIFLLSLQLYFFQNVTQLE